MAGRLLGQLRPADTVAASLYSPPANVVVRIDTIVITNTSGANANARVFLDIDGTTYDETTALIWDLTLASGDYIIVEGPFYMNQDAGNLGVRSSVGNALTFSAFGDEPQQ